MDINIWVTKKCNMKCTYCYEGIEKESLSMKREICDEVIQFINQLDETVSIRFHGGEPLIEYTLIKYFYNNLKNNKNVKRFGVTTNALLLDDEKIDFLIKTMEDLSVSIDGDEYNNDLNRRLKNEQGTYKLILPNLKKLLDRDPYIRARMTVTPDTVSNLDKNVEELIGIGFKVIAIAIDIFDKRWTKDNQEDYMNATLKIHKKYSKISQYSISVIDKSTLKLLKPCTGGKTSLHIAPNGDLYPCGLTVNRAEFKIGNIKSGISSKKVNALLYYNSLKNEECDGCTMYNHCNGVRCKMVNKIITGDCLCPPFAVCMEQNVKTQMCILN